AAQSAPGWIRSRGRSMTPPRQRHRVERGTILLELMLSLALLGVAGTSVLAAMSEALRNEAAWRRRESLYQTADRVLIAMSLLGRGDLDLRIGTRPVGELLVTVDRPEPTLYRVAVAAAEAPE